MDVDVPVEKGWPWTVEPNAVQQSIQSGEPRFFRCSESKSLSYTYGNVVSEVAAGTAKEFKTRQEARDDFYRLKRYRKLNNAFVVPDKMLDGGVENSSYLVFDQLFVSWEEWMTIIKLMRPASVANPAPLTRRAFRVINKLLKQMFDGNSPTTFSSLRDSIGVNRAHEVLFFQPPTSASRSFRANVLDLREVAEDLRASLFQIEGIYSATATPKVVNDIKESILCFEEYVEFIDTQFSHWVPFSKRTTQKSLPAADDDIRFALNHPTSYDKPATIRFFENIGFLATNYPLHKDSFYRGEVTKLKGNWRNTVDQYNANLTFQAILRFDPKTQIQRQQFMYQQEEIARFCNNSMKHYLDSLKRLKNGCPIMTKAEIIDTLCTLIGRDLPEKIFRAYAAAVMEGNFHSPNVHPPRFGATYIFSEDL